MRKVALFTFLLVGAISMIVMSAHYLQNDSTGILKRKEIANSLWYLLIFKSHVLLGLIAISVGPFQFVKKLRRTKPAMHRVIGYIYSVSVLLSGLSGLIIAQFAIGGMTSTVGFSMLSIIWLFVTVKAISSIRFGDIRNHTKWMYLSYSLTFAAITQRTLLLVPLLTEVPFIPIYQLSAWLPWMLNLSAGYYLFTRLEIDLVKLR